MTTTQQTTTAPFGISWCKVCGKQVRREGGRWKHMRPRPDGTPNDHPAKPGAAKPTG